MLVGAYAHPCDLEAVVQPWALFSIYSFRLGCTALQKYIPVAPVASIGRHPSLLLSRCKLVESLLSVGCSDHWRLVTHARPAEVCQGRCWSANLNAWLSMLDTV